MKVLITGAAGYLGPHVAKALAPEHQLRLSDIKPPEQDLGHEFQTVDVSSLEQVMRASEGMDAIVNCSVVRQGDRPAFGVNMGGCWNLMSAAVKHGIRRVINTGPHFTVAGPSYEAFDFAISPDGPPQPGTNLYALTKSLGHEICRVFTEHHEIYVLNYLFYNFRDLRGVPPDYYSYLRPGSDPIPFVVSGDDAGEAFRLGLALDVSKLPSRCEAFFILTDMPHGKFRNDKAKRLLGFRPRDDISALWRKPARL
ncbi:MAG TPA: NAD(P)-dependent oxidoreductase [Bryobacteraceae bacterium]|nr:NAD(P)-dependent oxidoreductase [Bryobacteraceae bacterium]